MLLESRESRDGRGLGLGKAIFLFRIFCSTVKKGTSIELITYFEASLEQRALTFQRPDVVLLIEGFKIAFKSYVYLWCIQCNHDMINITFEVKSGTFSSIKMKKRFAFSVPNKQDDFVTAFSPSTHAT